MEREFVPDDTIYLVPNYYEIYYKKWIKEVKELQNNDN